MPPEIEHSLIWTRQPIFHPAIVPEAISKRMDRDGMWGFTGSAPTSPPPSPSNLATCLPALAEWGVPADFTVTHEKGTAEEDEMVRRACEGVHEFVKLKWQERLWETAWFVNPPVGVSNYACNRINFLSVGFAKCPRPGPYTRLRATKIGR